MSDTDQEKSCAIVVTHNPDITALLKLLGQLNKETDFVVIDNDSPDIEQLAESITVYERCQNLVFRKLIGTASPESLRIVQKSH